MFTIYHVPQAAWATQQGALVTTPEGATHPGGDAGRSPARLDHLPQHHALDGHAAGAAILELPLPGRPRPGPADPLTGRP